MVRWIVGVILVVMVMVGGVRAESLRFDEGWRVLGGDVGGAEAVVFDDGKWEGVELPHDWSVAGTIEKGNAMTAQGGFFPAGVGWYRKRFVAPGEWAGKRVSVRFEGVYMLSDVWVNGEKVGEHAYGYAPFSVDVTGKLKVGAENVIAVRVDNSKQVNSRWYSGSGIEGHVWVEVTGTVRVARDGVQIWTEAAGSGAATVKIRITSERGSGDENRFIEYATDVFALDGNGKRSAEAVASFGPIGADFPVMNGVRQLSSTVETLATLRDAKWWTPETPNLYVAVTTASVKGAVIDRRETVFGVRTIGVSAEKGFLLNGERVVLYGGCFHHDNGALGAAAFDRAEERKVEILKGAGFNAVRTSHNMPPAAFLNACDRLGVMVLEEAFDCWEMGKNKEDYHKYFAENWKGDVDAMVMRDRNHPSVVMWSVGNEIADFGSAQGLSDGAKLIGRVKELDGTRPVTAAVNWWPRIGGKDHDWTWEGADQLMGQLDVVGYNYQIGRYAGDHARVPSRVMASTESYPRDMFACWAACEEKPYVVGDFVWTAMDYLGESGLGRVYAAGEKEIFQGKDEQFPVHGANCGDIDVTGWRKPVSHARNITWGRGEMLYTSVVEPRGDGKKWEASRWGTVPSWESWTWPGMEGKTMTVEVYSRCERVQLFLNEKLVGEKGTGLAEQFHATFEVPYEAGSLRTVGIVDGHAVASGELRTAGAVAGIRLVADREAIAADGEDLSFIAVESVDKDGNFQPNGNAEVVFSVTGEGRIVGVASGDLSGTEGYGGNRVKLFHGRGQVIVRSGHAAGKIEVKGRAEGLSEGRAEVEVR